MDMKSSLPLIVLLLLAACESNDEAPVLALKGATVIDGSLGSPLQNATILLQSGRVLAIGPDEDIDIPRRAEVKDVSGKFITPGIINAHGHVGEVKGIEGGHYSRENIIDNLSIYARYGITTVVSLGGDKDEAVGLRAVVDSASTGRARLFIAGPVITGTTPGEAVTMIDANHRLGVDFMKIRVDDNLGTSQKMTPDVYKTVIDRSHELGHKIATHLYYLSDAKDLLRAGSDLIAHSVRDLPVDEEFIGLMKEKSVCYCPTLTREVSTFVYGDTARFFTDPFFTQVYDEGTIAPLLDPARQAQVRASKSATIYRQQLPTALANLKRLADEGIPIAFGTDSGVATRFMGYFEHLEMEMMQQAGMSPAQIIYAATGQAARCLGLQSVGTLRAGQWADLIILDADPLTDIRNMREISAVYIAGVPLTGTAPEKK